MQFLQAISTAFHSEARLATKHKAKLIYLVDFEVLFSLLIPYLDVDRTPNDYINNLSATEFFSSPEAQIALPPGTLVELGKFLERQLQKVRDLGAIQEATSLEKAVAKFEDYLERSVEEEEFDFSSYEEGHNLVRLQMQAIKLLSQHQTALGRLDSFLKRAEFFDLYELISTHPVPIPGYRNFFSVLQRARPEKSSKSNDMADALNLSFTYNINVELERKYLAEQLPSRHIFRLMTNTRTLHRIANRSVRGARVLQDLTYIGPEHETLPLVTGTDEALGTQLFRKRYEKTTTTDFIEFKKFLGGADVAILELEAAASKRNIAPADILARLLDPSEEEDRELFLSCKQPIDTIRTLVRLGSDTVPSFVERSLRRHLIAPAGEDTSGPLKLDASHDLAALENLIESIYEVLDRVDTLGYHLTPFQIGDFAPSSQISNPVASLKNLGVEVAYRESGPVKQWCFRRQRPSGNILTLEKSAQHWACSWRTAIPAPQSAQVFLRYYTNLPHLKNTELDSVKLVTIQLDGTELSETLALDGVAAAIDDKPLLSFYSLTARDQALTSEIYTPLPRYELRTGITMKYFNLHLVEHLFIPTSKHRGDLLLCRLMRNKLNEIISETA